MILTSELTIKAVWAPYLISTNLEKLLGFRNMQEKLENGLYFLDKTFKFRPLWDRGLQIAPQYWKHQATIKNYV